MKKTIKMNDGSVQITNPSRIKVIQPLKNGSYLVMWFDRYRVTGKEWSKQKIKAVWNVSMYVGTIKGANKWKHKQHARITGDGSLEALKLAQRYINGFAKGFIHFGSEMRIAWLDEKRHRVYNYLLRYDGFIEDEKNKCIYYRNPKYYEWVGLM